MRKFQSHVLFVFTVALAAVIFLDGMACRASAQEASGIFIQDKSLAVSVALNSNGTQVAIGTIGAARVWKTASPKEPPFVLAHNCDVQRVFFTPDDQSLITVCNDGAIRIWSLLDRKQTPTLFRGNDDITDASMTRDGMLLATASWKRAVQVWNLKKLDSPVTYDPKIRLAFQSVAFSPSGERMVASVDDNALIWDVEEHPVDPFQIVRAPSKKESRLRFSPLR